MNEMKGHCGRPEGLSSQSLPPGHFSDQRRLFSAAAFPWAQDISNTTLIGAEHRRNVLNFVPFPSQKANSLGFEFTELSRSSDADDVEKHPVIGVLKCSHGKTPFMAAMWPIRSHGCRHLGLGLTASPRGRFVGASRPQFPFYHTRYRRRQYVVKLDAGSSFGRASREGCAT